MISEKFYTPIRALLILSFFIFLTNRLQAQDGKALFASKCATCHNVFKKVTGPALGGFQERDNGKWSDIKQLTAWIKNPAGFMASDPYTANLKAEYGTIMQASPDITEAEVTAIASYINETFAKGPGGGGPVPTDTGTAKPSGQGAILFGIISLIMAIIALILLQVNSNLKKLRALAVEKDATAAQLVSFDDAIDEANLAVQQATVSHLDALQGVVESLLPSTDAAGRIDSQSESICAPIFPRTIESMAADPRL